MILRRGVIPTGPAGRHSRGPINYRQPDASSENFNERFQSGDKSHNRLLHIAPLRRVQTEKEAIICIA